ncbi:MAG: LysR family transcriptional regulator, partial [Phyllobacterium sp.]
MLDGLSLDHLRTFVAAADEGSFSAAGRKLGRAQSVVSQAIANLEGQLGLLLFERVGRYPQLTPHARNLLTAARQIVRDADTLKASARRLSEGLEPFLSIVIDVMFPQRLLTEVVGD